MSEAEQKEKDILRLSKKMSDFSFLVKKVMKGEGIQEKELRSGSKINQVVEARKLFCQLAVKKMGYPGAEVARFLGVTTSAVNKAANSEEVSSLKRYL
jgi:chromosomal replication initiation ATPase DnaA